MLEYLNIIYLFNCLNVQNHTEKLENLQYLLIVWLYLKDFPSDMRISLIHCLLHAQYYQKMRPNLINWLKTRSFTVLKTIIVVKWGVHFNLLFFCLTNIKSFKYLIMEDKVTIETGFLEDILASNNKFAQTFCKINRIIT